MAEVVRSRWAELVNERLRLSAESAAIIAESRVVQAAFHIAMLDTHEQAANMRDGLAKCTERLKDAGSQTARRRL